MTNFLERFKGKTSLMGKEGLPGLMNDSDKPIMKPNFISIVNEKENLVSPKLKVARSLNYISSKNVMYNNLSQRNSYSISSQSKKTSHLIQAAKNSIGMATYDFAPPDRNSNNNISYDYGTNTESKIQFSASPSISKSLVNTKARYSPFRASLEVRKESTKSLSLPKIKTNGYIKGKLSDRRNSGITIIKEQNEEPDEEFEDLEKKHLEFLNVIEKMNLK